MSGTAAQPGLPRLWTRCLCWLPLLLVLGMSGLGQLHAQAPPLPLLPSGIAYDAAGNLYIADAARNQVYESSVGGALTVIAGTGAQGYRGDGAAATAALLNAPQGIAVATDGTLYIADTGNQRVRAIDVTGTIRTVAGTGQCGFGGDGGLATAALLCRPVALAVESGGAVLVADRSNHRIRRVSGGVISTIAGTGVQGFGGDGGAATAALLDSPAGVAVAPDGRLVVSDERNQRVRVIAVDGTIGTLAGTGVAGFSGDGGAAASAQLADPRGVAVLPDGSVLVADAENQRLRMIATSGVIRTVAGAGMQGSAADANVANGAALNLPRTLAVSPFGSPVFAEGPNRMVRALLGGALYSPAGLAGPRISSVKLSVPAQAVYGSAVASVQVTGPVGSPQGTAELREGGAIVARGKLSGSSATLPLASLNAGPHQLSAAYAGDGFNPAATVGSVTPVEIARAPVVASAQDATVAYGAPLPVLTGSLSGVLAKDASEVQAVYRSNATAFAAVGVYPIGATLTGSAAGNYTLTMASGSGSLHVVQAGSTTAVLPPPATYAGLPMTLTATVAPSTAGVPTGAVTFTDGATVIATARVSAGVATAVYLQPGSGSHSLTASYSGDGNFLPSVSAATVSSVAAMPDFALATSAGRASQTVQAGTVANFPLLISGSPGPFSGVVSLSASGLPANVQATFSPVAVVPGAGVATTTMSVPTGLLLSRNARPQPRDSQPGGLKRLAFLAVMLLPLPWLRRRRLPRMLVLLLAAVACAGVVGCGARVAPEAVTNSRTYTITVTGTGTSLAGTLLTHTATVTLTVE